MTAYGTEFFSMNGVNRLRILQNVRLPVIQAVCEKCLRRRDAASRLGISERQAQRLTN